MQPVRLTIDGLFWDVQLYSGRLYLFGRDGSVATLNWDSLVESLSADLSDRLAIECAFKRSDYLYARDFRLFFQDDDIKETITQKFESLADRSLFVTRSQIQNYLIDQQLNPFPFPHADCTIYKNRMWIVGMDGIFSGTCSGRTKHPISTKINRSWDAPIFATSASYGTLALAAGSDGLWEHNLDDDLIYDYGDEPHQIAPEECDSCDWMYHSIYGKSYEGGFLAEFERNPAGDENFRQFRETISSNRIFDRQGYSWGARDKIYLASDGYLDVVKYSPYRGDLLTQLGSYSIDAWKGEIVSGGVAPFGAIAEYQSAIVVIPSVGPPVTLAGEPVRWRVYPRSTYYKNHLHVVYEDRLEILSFNHDYFVDQSSKVFGSVLAHERQQTR